MCLCSLTSFAYYIIPGVLVLCRPVRRDANSCIVIITGLTVMLKIVSIF